MKAGCVLRVGDDKLPKSPVCTFLFLVVTRDKLAASWPSHRGSFRDEPCFFEMADAPFPPVLKPIVGLVKQAQSLQKADPILAYYGGWDVGAT
jgi:hypothetical protein